MVVVVAVVVVVVVVSNFSLQTNISKCKITTLKERSKTELTGRTSLRMRRYALGCSAMYEGKEEELVTLPVGTFRLQSPSGKSGRV